jgi:ligand-binding sensor domain-containing protein/signal transduction histidine kinase
MCIRPQPPSGRLCCHALRIVCSSVFALLFFASTGYSSDTDTRTHPVRLPVTEGKDIRFTHLSSEQGLLQSNFAQILQDDRGFIWFGAMVGLRRYDGYHFKEYRHDPGNPNGLSGNTISALYKDSSGKLWIGTDTGLDQYNPTTDRITHYASDPRTTGIDGPVFDINQDRKGTIWLATTRGLCRLDPATGRTVRYQHEPSDSSSVMDSQVKSTFEEKDGTFWVAMRTGLDIFDRDKGKVTRHFPVPSENRRTSLFEDHAGVLWAILSASNGLAVVDRRTNRVTQYSFKDNSEHFSGVGAIHEDGDGTLWLGTRSNGLLKLDRNRKEFVRYRNDPSDPDSLSADQVSALFEDREGNIWVATPAGVDRFSRRHLPFRTYRHEPDNPNSLDGGLPQSVFEDSRGILWVGALTALNRIDRRTGRFTFYRGSGPGSLSGPFESIAEDRTGSLWFGSGSEGLNRFDERTGRFKAYRHNPADPHSLSQDNVASLLVDHKGILWAGTMDGLNAFDPETERFRVYRASAVGPNHYRVMAEDSQGTLWLGTLSSGLHHLEPATGQFTIYRHQTEVAGNLSSDLVNAICIDHSGIIWVGTQSGLNRFDPATRTFTIYDERDGLPSNNVNGILEDERGNLWLGTSNGLSRFDPRGKTFVNYDASDGIPRNDFYGKTAGWKSPSGEMFFNSYGGVLAFFPEKVVDNSYIPSVALTDFQLFGKPAPIGGDSPLQQSITVTNSLTLTHTQNVFSLEFSVLSYANPERNRFRYKLEGLETGWNEVPGTHRLVTYTTLPAGDYVLRVQGATNRGVWNDKGVALRLRILPPWWSTWWFRSLAAALVLLSLGSVHHFRLQNIERRFNMRLEERVGERTRIARELHDTLLQSFQGLMLRFQVAYDEIPARPAEARKTLGNALDLAAQAITDGRDAVQGLRSSRIERNDLAQAIGSLGQELASHETNSNRVESFVDVEGTPRDVHPILRDEIYRIAGEALRNAFRHAHARRLQVAIEYGERQFRLRVRDDGKGIDPELVGKQGRAGHWGLAGMRERAVRIGGNLEIRSQRESGTEVELSIPALIAYATSRARRRARLFTKMPFAKKTGTKS